MPCYYEHFLRALARRIPFSNAASISAIRNGLIEPDSSVSITQWLWSAVVRASFAADELRSPAISSVDFDFEDMRQVEDLLHSR